MITAIVDTKSISQNDNYKLKFSGPLGNCDFGIGK